MNILPKVAVYLDEVNDDPTLAMQHLAGRGVRNVCLRKLWSRHICGVPDQILGMLLRAFESTNSEPILLDSLAGTAPVTALLDPPSIESFEHAIKICQFLECKAMTVGLGKPVKDDRWPDKLDDWMQHVSDRCLHCNIVPCIILSHDNPVASPPAIAALLAKHKRWKIVYDPGSLVMERRIDPFTKYWSLFKHQVFAFDIHDYAIGKRPVPAGQGDAKLALTLSDAITSDYRGWFCVEPGLGRKYVDISGKDKVFDFALDSFFKLLESIQLSVSPPNKDKTDDRPNSRNGTNP